MISILITHYNRFESLEKCLHAIRSFGFFDYEVVVSDDYSSIDVQKKLKTLDVDQLILTDKNRGLASNINRGIKVCKGEFILYCQEDFMPTEDFKIYLSEAIDLLERDLADMCRLRSNYKFPYLMNLSEHFKTIPKFSWKNFYYNHFQYSDNPYLTKRSFFDKFGFYLENVSGDYGENEYAIRMMKSKAKIAIANKNIFKSIEDSHSVIKNEKDNINKRVFLKRINMHKFLRASRLMIEFMLYSSTKRKLYSIKNHR